MTVTKHDDGTRTLTHNGRLVGHYAKGRHIWRGVTHYHIILYAPTERGIQCALMGAAA
jgi:hypothetical protein